LMKSRGFPYLALDLASPLKPTKKLALLPPSTPVIGLSHPPDFLFFDVIKSLPRPTFSTQIFPGYPISFLSSWSAVNQTGFRPDIQRPILRFPYLAWSPAFAYSPPLIAFFFYALAPFPPWCFSPLRWGEQKTLFAGCGLEFSKFLSFGTNHVLFPALFAYDPPHPPFGSSKSGVVSLAAPSVNGRWFPGSPSRHPLRPRPLFCC